MTVIVREQTQREAEKRHQEFRAVIFLLITLAEQLHDAEIIIKER